MMAEGEAKSADDAATADDAEVPEPQLWLPATEVGTTTPLPSSPPFPFAEMSTYGCGEEAH